MLARKGIITTFLVICTLTGFTLLLGNSVLNTHQTNVTNNLVDEQLSPKVGSLHQYAPYPAEGQILTQLGTYNLTAGLRDDANWNRTFNGGSLTVNRTSFPLGSFEGSYSSFESINDNLGGVPYNFTETYNGGTGSAQIIQSYMGHDRVLNVTTGTSTYTWVTNTKDPTGWPVLNVSVWFNIPTMPGTLDTFEPLSVFGPGGESSVWVNIYNGNMCTLGNATVICPVAANTWNYLMYEINMPAGQFNVWLNGVKYGPYGTFAARTNNIAQSYTPVIKVASFSAYIDGFDWSVLAGSQCIAPGLQSNAFDSAQSGTTFSSNLTFTPLGTFKGSYSSFDSLNDSLGGVPYNFTETYNGGTGSAQIIQSYMGHDRVLNVTTGTSTNTWVTNTKDPTGWPVLNVSVWFNIPTMPGTLDTFEPLSVFGPGGESSVWVNIYNGNMCTLGNATVICPVAANTWNYLMYEINMPAGQFNVWLNGVKYGPYGTFAARTNNIAQSYTPVIKVASFSAYIDGFDWSVLAGSQYVAPGVQSNAIDSSPLGLYSATQSFESFAPFTSLVNGTSGSYPPETNEPLGSLWGYAQGASDQVFSTPAVATAATSHKNIVCTTANGNPGNAWLYYGLGGSTGSLTVEFWAYSGNIAHSGDLGYMYVYDQFPQYGGDIVCGEFDYLSGDLLLWNGASVQYIMPYTTNTWYHIRYAINYGTKTYNAYVNGQLEATNYNFNNATAHCINYLFLGTRSGTAGVTAYNYWDAIDVSADPAYSTERSSYMLLQQNVAFSTSGSYSFLFTLNSNGTNYPGSWTDFSFGNNSIPNGKGIPFTLPVGTQLVSIKDDYGNLLLEMTITVTTTIQMTANITDSFSSVVLQNGQRYFAINVLSGTFTAPAAAKFYYNGSKLTADQEQNLSIYCLDTSNRWINQNGTLYPNENFILLNVNHFSTYAIAISNQTSQNTNSFDPLLLAGILLGGVAVVIVIVIIIKRGKGGKPSSTTEIFSGWD